MHVLASGSAVRAGTNIAGKFLLEAPLAQGGMGSVWRARHLDLEVEVAIKLISSELGANEQALEMPANDGTGVPVAIEWQAGQPLFLEIVAPNATPSACPIGGPRL